MKTLAAWLLPLFFVLSFQGCSDKVINTHGNVFTEHNRTAGFGTVAVCAFDNYTETPQAGKRAANLARGVLSGNGILTADLINDTKTSLDAKIEAAAAANATYLLTGGVSEWRYKTGIDGEPAVSLTMSLIEVQTRQTVWSATGSSNDWGNSSIGTTAQELIDTMLR